jgi:hypothetical protein
LRWFVLVTALAFAAPTNANPLYLRCTVEGAANSFGITLDEERGTAVTLGQTAPANFALDDVTFQATLANILSVGYTINRKTLDFIAISSVRGMEPTKKSGKCELVKATGNKI